MTDPGLDRDGGGSVVERPTAAAAVRLVERASARGQVASLVGPCHVETEGRRADGLDGSSRDGPGPIGARHVLLKPDGSVVVHARSGTAALYAFDAGEGLRASVEDGRLVVEAGRDRLAFDRVDRLAWFGLDAASGMDDPDDTVGNRDTAGEPVEHGSLRDRLVEHPDLVEPGFRPRSTERATAAGPVDLYGHDAEGRAVVVEVKAHRAGPAAVGQLDRYVAALRRDLHADAAVRGILVAPSATERTRTLLAERGYAFRTVQPST